MRAKPIVIKNVFPPSICEQIIEYKKKDVRAGLVGHKGGSVVKKIRRSNVCFMDKNDPFTPWLNVAKDHIAKVAREVHKINIVAFERVQFTEYLQFGYYRKHFDTSHNGPIRRISATLELSDPKSIIGGGLNLYFEKKFSPKKEQGSLVIFPSCVLHEAKTVWWGKRYSLVFWGFTEFPDGA